MIKRRTFHSNNTLLKYFNRPQYSCCVFHGKNLTLCFTLNEDSDSLRSMRSILLFKMYRRLDKMLLPILFLFVLMIEKVVCLDVKICWKLSAIHSTSGN